MSDDNNGLKILHSTYGYKLVNLQSQKIGGLYSLAFNMIKHLYENRDRPTYLSEIVQFEEELKRIVALKITESEKK